VYLKNVTSKQIGMSTLEAVRLVHMSLSTIFRRTSEHLQSGEGERIPILCVCAKI